MRNVPIRTCRRCGVEFKRRTKSGHGLQIAFCDDCLRTIKSEAQRARRAEQRAKRPPISIECAHCAKTFTPARVDARFCSGRCRVAHHRASA